MTNTEMITAINYLVKTGASFDDLVNLALDYRDRFGSWIAVPTLLAESDAPEFYCTVDFIGETRRPRCYVSAELGAKSWRDCFDWMIHKCKTPADRDLYEIGYCEEIEEEPEVDESDLSWIDDESFALKVHQLAADYGMDFIMGLPGVYEIVSEALNNDVIEALQDER